MRQRRQAATAADPVWNGAVSDEPRPDTIWAGSGRIDLRNVRKEDVKGRRQAQPGCARKRPPAWFPSEAISAPSPRLKPATRQPTESDAVGVNPSDHRPLGAPLICQQRTCLDDPAGHQQGQIHTKTQQGRRSKDRQATLTSPGERSHGAASGNVSSCPTGTPPIRIAWESTRCARWRTRQRGAPLGAGTAHPMHGHGGAAATRGGRQSAFRHSHKVGVDGRIAERVKEGGRRSPQQNGSKDHDRTAAAQPARGTAPLSGHTCGRRTPHLDWALLQRHRQQLVPNQDAPRPQAAAFRATTVAASPCREQGVPASGGEERPPGTRPTETRTRPWARDPHAARTSHPAAEARRPTRPHRVRWGGDGAGPVTRDAPRDGPSRDGGLVSPRSTVARRTARRYRSWPGRSRRDVVGQGSAAANKKPPPPFRNLRVAEELAQRLVDGPQRRPGLVGRSRA